MSMNDARIESNASVGQISTNRRFLRARASISSRLQLLLDISAVELTLYFVMLLRGNLTPGVYLYPSILAPILMWLIYSNSGVYSRFSTPLGKALKILWAWTRVVVILLISAFISKISGEYSRLVIVSWFIMAGVLQIASHMAVNSFILTHRKRQFTPALLVGNTQLGDHLVRNTNGNPWTPHRIVGVLSDSTEEEPWHITGLAKLGSIGELREMVKKYHVRRVYFALPINSRYEINNLQMQLVDLNVDIVWAPDISGFHLLNPSVKEVAGIPLIYLSESPMVEGARLSKLLFDKIVASIALLILSPLMLAAAIAVKLSSPGPILFRQERHGLDGRIIRVMKFRSMVVHKEKEGEVTQARKDDSRITKVGAFFRKTSIDELPQLFNVLNGDMSLVGPRPHAKEHNHFYSDKIQVYMSRHRILPGMTGLAQVNGFRGETDTLDKMEKRIEFDLAYINNWSILLDIQIMLKTVYTLFSKNAY